MTHIKRKKDIRTELLATGMGCFAFASGATAVNVLALPFARALYGYSLPMMLGGFALALAGFALAAMGMRRADEARLLRMRRIAVPVYLIALFAVQIALAYLLEYTPSGDNFMLYNGSQMMAADGNFDRYPDFGLYLARYKNQWGFFLMLTGFYKLLAALGIAATFMPLALVQAVLYTAGVCAGLRIAKRLGGVRGEMMFLLMMICCLPVYPAAGVLYTDTFSLPFVLMAPDFALRAADGQDARARMTNALICALLCVLGGQIKMTVMIVLMAAAIVWVIKMPLKQGIACALMAAVLAAGGQAAVKDAMLSGPVDPDVHAQQYTPPIHWIMMSIPTGDNPYGGVTGDYGITWGMMDEGASREAIMDSIYTRMKDRIYTLRYPNRLMAAALRKNSNAMGDGAFGMTEMLDDGPVRRNIISEFVLEDGRYFTGTRSFCTGVWMAYVVLACIGCVRDIRRRDVRAAMGYIAMFGMMLFLMIWEARGRYVFGFVPVMLLLAGRAFAQREA